MPDTQLPPATAGDTIDSADLAQSISDLRAIANAMNARIPGADVPTVQAIVTAQTALLDRADDLVDAQIDLLAGQAKVTADQIAAATAAARQTIDQIKDWKKAAVVIGEVVDFAAVVLTGDGAKILASAITLKKELDTATV
jgi:hypothetical protein